jgi:hypothetical protein
MAPSHKPRYRPGQHSVFTGVLPVNVAPKNPAHVPTELSCVVEHQTGLQIQNALRIAHAFNRQQLAGDKSATQWAVVVLRGKEEKHLRGVESQKGIAS